MQQSDSTNLDSLNADELLDILSWYALAGVDEAISDEVTNHFENLTTPITLTTPIIKPAPILAPAPNAEPAPQTPTTRAPQAAAITTAAPKTNQTRLAKDLRAGQVNYQHSIKLAQKLSAACDDLNSLSKALHGFEECSLKLTAKHLIFGEGNEHADIMLIGESPGRDEDMIGHAFAGTAGLMLDQILAAIGLERKNVYLAYLLPWRSLGGVAPSQANIDICQPFLTRQIELVKPKIIITFDALVCKILTQQKGSILQTRGKFTEIILGEQSFKTIPTFHPQLLQANPNYKQLVWQDFLSAKSAV
ncbi:MAG: uracil-DNA glycosylase [Rhizobiales bacterium]|nr:uracil-DNA glycosylase [Hyphomicrobiales bacterium]NRB13469.1 uracil-DNA glycosylase [Hyphomicrobiales bacterium]